MKLSTRAIYGLRALIDLGSFEEEEAVSIQSIADRQGISVGYLEQLMALLKKAGIVKSSRGANGGYRLGAPAQEISVGDVLRVLEGSLEAVVCPGAQRSCNGADSCVARIVWQRINDGITQAVDSLMLSELIGENQKLQKKKEKRYRGRWPDGDAAGSIINETGEIPNGKNNLSGQRGDDKDRAGGGQGDAAVFYGTVRESVRRL